MKRTLTRITAALLVICLLAGVADAGNRIGTRRALLTVAEEISYLLRATFTATDQGYSDAQVLDDPSEGIEDGQLTVVEVDGTLAIVGNECAFTAQGTPAWGDQGFYSQAITRALGRGLLFTFSSDTIVTGERGFVGWGISAAVHSVDNGESLGINPQGAFLTAYHDTSNRNIAAYSISTDYGILVVLGGYASDGLAYYSGQTKANYKYGAAWYIKGGLFSNWTLLWRDSQTNTTPIYAVVDIHSWAGAVDNFRVPDRDLSAVLQPTVLALFQAANGTSLDAVTNEVGGVWTEQTGDLDIQGNKANVASLTGARAIGTVDAGISDLLLDVTIDPENTASLDAAIARYTDGNNMWFFRWLNDGVTDEVQLYEVNASVWTKRSSTALAPGVAGEAYDLRVIADGQSLDLFINGDNKTSYASAALNETATVHGIFGSTNAGATYDNFATYPRTSSVYDAELEIP